MTVLGFDLHTTIVNSPAVFNARLVQTPDYECDWDADTYVGVCVDAGSGSGWRSEQYEEEGQGMFKGAAPKWVEIRVREDEDIFGPSYSSSSAYPA
ncbi:hypothetical protein V8E52_009953 [Russula decolorans]